MIDRGGTLALVEWPSPVAALPPALLSGLLLVLLIGGLAWFLIRQPVFGRFLPGAEAPRKLDRLTR